MSEYVYVMGRDDGAHKIGCTRDVAMRVKHVGWECGCSVWLVRAFHRPAGDGFGVEKFTHRLFQIEDLGGEWFVIPAERAVNALQMACESFDNSLYREARRLNAPLAELQAKKLAAALLRKTRESKRS